MHDALIWLRAQWDRVAGTACIGAGAVVLLVTFQGVAHSRFVADQIAEVTSGGLGALFLVAVGVMLRLQGDLHDEWRKLDRIDAALRGETRPDAAALYLGGGVDGLAPNAFAGDDAAGARSVDRARRVRGATSIPLLAMGAALAVIVVGHRQAANTADVDRAITGLAVGVGGLGLAALVAAATVLAGRARLAGRKATLLGPWLRPAVAGPADPGPEPVPAGMVCVAPQLTRFHRDGCPTLAHATFDSIPREAVPAGLRPCQICGAR